MKGSVGYRCRGKITSQRAARERAKEEYLRYLNWIHKLESNKHASCQSIATKANSFLIRATEAAFFQQLAFESILWVSCSTLRFDNI